MGKQGLAELGMWLCPLSPMAAQSSSNLPRQVYIYRTFWAARQQCPDDKDWDSSQNIAFYGYLMRLIAQDNFTEFSCHKSYKSYISTWLIIFPKFSIFLDANSQSFFHPSFICKCEKETIEVDKWWNRSIYLSLSRRLSTVPANSNTADKYTVEVVRMAQMVPTGIDFWASAKSPDLLEPAIIPRMEGKSK